MKRIKQVFSYQGPPNRLVTYAVERRCVTEIVLLKGISGMILRVTELDTRGPYPLGYYFTTPRLAIEAFIAKAEAALARPCDTENRKAWRNALAIARGDFSSQIRTRKNVLTVSSATKRRLGE